VIAVGEDRIEPDGSVEVFLRSSYIAQVVFGYSPEKEAPVIGAVEPGKDIEMFNGLGVFAVLESQASAHVEHVFVVLGKD
jgi:hypothetical protein